MDLTEAVFSRARLTATGFARSRLSRAKLSRAEISFTHFEAADLSGADFERAAGWRANFSRANLKGATFYAADMSRGLFVPAKLVGANFAKSEMNRSDFSGAELTDANMSKAELTAQAAPNPDEERQKLLSWCGTAGKPLVRDFISITTRTTMHSRRPSRGQKRANAKAARTAVKSVSDPWPPVGRAWSKPLLG